MTAAPVTTTPHAAIAAPAPAMRKKWALRLLRWLVALVALTWLFTHVPLRDVAAVLAQTRPLPIVAAMAAAVLAHLLIALRLKRLTDAHGLGLSTREVFGINLSTLFYGLLVPAGNFVGIGVRFYRLSGAQRKLAAAGVALLLDRTAATATLCLAGAAFWLLERPAGTELVPIVMLGALVAMAGVLALLATPLRFPGLTRLTGILLRFQKLRSLREALRSSRALPRRAWLPLVGYSLAAHLVGVLGYWLVAVALGVDLSPISAGWLRSSMIFAAMLPISIAGLGVREGTAVALLGSYGIAADEALAFSLVAFATSVLFPALLGGLVEFRRLR